MNLSLLRFNMGYYRIMVYVEFRGGGKVTIQDCTRTLPGHRTEVVGTNHFCLQDCLHQYLNVGGYGVVLKENQWKESWELMTIWGLVNFCKSLSL
jgi:hypothetical protein